MANDPLLKRGDQGPSVAEAQDLLNRSGAILDPDGDFGGGTEAAVREFQEAEKLTVNGQVDAATWLRLRALPELSPDIPSRAVAFIGRKEVGSRRMYDLSNSRPTWPKGASGITIGIGYDLGYQSTFEQDWSDVLSPTQMAALRPWLGKKGGSAEAGPPVLSEISIPWHASWMVFIRRTLPEEISKTRRTFQRCDELPPMCLGMLVSLVYNRGASMEDSKNFSLNRKEMRDIRDAMAAGRFADIPAALRSMSRLWPDLPGLVERREDEATVFEQALAERQGSKGLSARTTT